MKQQLIKLSTLIALIAIPLAMNARTEKKGYNQLEKIKETIFSRLPEERRNTISQQQEARIERTLNNNNTRAFRVIVIRNHTNQANHRQPDCPIL